MNFALMCEKIKYKYLHPLFKKLGDISIQDNKKYQRAIKVN